MTESQTSDSPRDEGKPYRLDDVVRLKPGVENNGTVVAEGHHWVTVQWEQIVVNVKDLEMVKRWDE